MTTDELLRDALLEDADGDAAPANWDGVRARGTRIRRRRRGGQAAVALVSVVAIAAGVLAVAGAFSDDGSGTRHGVVATPPGPVTDRIAVDRGDRVEIISSTDGHVISTVATGLDSNPGGVSGAPDGSAIVYTRRNPASPCGTELVEKPAVGDEHVIVGHSWDPLVSPDGQWVAYVMVDLCDANAPSPEVVGLTNLRTGVNYRPAESYFVGKASKIDLLGWSPDSSRLIFNQLRRFEDGSDEKAFSLDRLPFGPGTPTPIPAPGLIGAATYLPDGRLLAALPSGNGYEVVEFDGASVVGTRFRASGVSPSSMALDPSGTRLLLTLPDGNLLVQEGTGDPRPVATGVQSAAWLP